LGNRFSGGEFVRSPGTRIEPLMLPVIWTVKRSGIVRARERNHRPNLTVNMTSTSADSGSAQLSPARSSVRGHFPFPEYIHLPPRHSCLSGLWMRSALDWRIAKRDDLTRCVPVAKPAPPYTSRKCAICKAVPTVAGIESAAAPLRPPGATGVLGSLEFHRLPLESIVS
jgi:hypothetical protein